MRIHARGGAQLSPHLSPSHRNHCFCGGFPSCLLPAACRSPELSTLASAWYPVLHTTHVCHTPLCPKTAGDTSEASCLVRNDDSMPLKFCHVGMEGSGFWCFSKGKLRLRKSEVACLYHCPHSRGQSRVGAIVTAMMGWSLISQGELDHLSTLYSIY